MSHGHTNHAGCQIIDVTPSMAREWIAATGDRNFRRPDIRRVGTIAEDITAGRWQFNGATIVLNGEVVLDGLHRLHAAVQAGKPIKTVVVQGVMAAANETIDRGRPRSLAQWLSYKKVSRSRDCATVTRHWHAYNNGLWSCQSFPKPSEGVLIRFFRDNRDRIEESARLGGKSVSGGLRPSVFVPMSLLGVVLCEGIAEGAIGESETAQVFLSELSSGTSSYPGSPVIHLRNRMIANKQGSTRLARPMERALIIQAWNLLVQGDSVDRLFFRLTGPSAQAFPTIQLASI